MPEPGRAEPGRGEGHPGRTPLRGSRGPRATLGLFPTSSLAVFWGSRSRVHGTPEPDSPRSQAAPQHRPAETQTKGLGAAGAGQGRGATPGGGRWHISIRPPGCQNVPSHGLQTLYKVNLVVGCGFSFLSGFTHRPIKGIW